MDNIKMEIEPPAQYEHKIHGNHTKANQRSLRILMVAPQPFFSARGTPFSVLHRIRALVTEGHQVDLITYPFGEDVSMGGLRIIRSRSLPGVTKIKIGPSISKFFLDIPLYFETVKALKNNQYDVLHSHEEAAFFCVSLAKRYSLVHIYDMHSSLPQQLSNFKAYNIPLFRSIFEKLEDYVLNTCDGIITICDDLADIPTKRCPEKPHKMIENIGEDGRVFRSVQEDLTQELSLHDNRVLLYTGTLETYQGIDMLLSAMQNVLVNNSDVVLVVVGGTPEQVETYWAKAKDLGVNQSVRLTGTVHPSRIPNFMNIADLIVSPRSRGTNTPLKIYGYMRSGVPLVATDRHTHTQILSRTTAELVPADAQGLANGINRVLADKSYAEQLANAAKLFAERNFSDAKYVKMVNDLYTSVLNRNPLQGS